MSQPSFPRSVLVLVAVSLAIVLGSAATARAEGTAAVSTKANTRFECPGCLVAVSPEADRCPECGVSFKKLEYECPKCRTGVAYDATRCPKCGLVFDAPVKGAKEKRSAVEREMPITRDFMRNPEAPADPNELEVHGSSLTLWRTGHETGPSGGRTITRFAEDLNVEVLHIGIPELSFHGSALLLSDPSQRPESPNTIKLREAYFRYESADEKTQAQAGRQYIVSGVTNEFVDGLYAHQLLGDRLGIELFGGHPVATDKSEPGGDVMGGGRIFFRGVPKLLTRELRDLTIGFSAQEERWDGRTVQSRIGFDASFSPTWDYDISGHAYYDLITLQLYDARFTVAARPTTGIQITIDYNYVVPSAMLPASDLFSVFADDRRHEFELDIDLYPTERLKLTAMAKLVHIPDSGDEVTSITSTPFRSGEEDPYELGGGFSYKHGTLPFKGEFGGSASIVLKGGIHQYEGATVRHASFFTIRGYEMVSYDLTEIHRVKGSFELQIEAYDGRIYRRQNSAGTATLTGGYVYKDAYSFTLGGDYRSSPDFTNTGDVFAKFEVKF